MVLKIRKIKRMTKLMMRPCQVVSPNMGLKRLRAQILRPVERKPYFRLYKKRLVAITRPWEYHQIGNLTKSRKISMRICLVVARKRDLTILKE